MSERHSPYRPPPEPTTVAMPQVPQWAIDLTRLVKDVKRDVGQIGARLETIEDWKEEATKRLDKMSDRAKQPSQHDLEAQAALAKEIAAREALASKVDKIEAETSQQTAILTKLDGAATKLAGNPIFRMFVTVVGTAFLTWIAEHTVTVQTKPVLTVPSSTILVSPDGGR